MPIRSVPFLKQPRHIRQVRLWRLKVSVSMSVKAEKKTKQKSKERSGGSPRPPLQHSVVIGLSAVIVTVENETPYVLVVERPEEKAEETRIYGLPFGLFNPDLHRTTPVPVPYAAGTRPGIPASSLLAISR